MGKKEIREKFRNDVLARDNFKCRLCGRSDVKLDVHHITNRTEIVGGGYVLSNGISLCDNGDEGCHLKVENFYFSDNRDNEPENPFHPLNLYKMIKSSQEKAFSDSLKL